MNTEIFGIAATFILTLLLAYPLGKYMTKVFKGEKVWSDFLKPLENLIFRISGIDPDKPMDWKEGLKAMLLLNVVFFVWVYVLLLIKHPFLNPMDIPGMEASLAFNTAASFVSNTNLQHYSGESGASYFTQIFLLMFMQFVSAATGIAALAMLFKGLVQRQMSDLGNFYSLLVKSTTRILLPFSVVVAVILLLNGTPMTFSGAQKIITLQGDTVSVATGPAAGMVAIKQLGTNGGGFFGVNSAHPLENPNYLTNMVENISILIIAIGLVFSFGFYLEKKKLGYIFFGVMALIMLLFLSLAVKWETGGNPEIKAMGISQQQASNMEGKEVRFGPAASAYWGVTTTSTSNGSVNSMHDSFMPLSGGLFMVDMMINSIFGGVGVGFLNFFIYLVIAVFIAGLMVGRTPELLGKKIEAKEVKIAAVVLLLHPLLILVGTAIAAHISAINPSIGWTPNPGYHGFSEMLYEFTSSSANNGSGFEGLVDNTYFWNIMCGIVMLLARFIPIIGPVAIAGLLAGKKKIPESAGTLRIDSLTFGVVLIAVIAIVAALSFFPALAVGPIAEHFSM
ncbi:MAG TPA: potassium-transporting ATPase subunit KdpA [Ignavibacteriales bacterium]|nr:potassium-transporting ATPase subunit KdpA [Ignavibacteriales bacterium]